MADASANAVEPPEPEAEPAPDPEAGFEAWEAAEDAVGTQEALVVSLDGFEGPLDVLLALARTQKVDLAMQALSGSVAERASAVLAAGSDVVLACNGGLAESQAVATVAPGLQGAGLQRYERARAVLRQQQPFAVAEAEACLAEVLRAAA